MLFFFISKNLEDILGLKRNKNKIKTYNKLARQENVTHFHKSTHFDPLSQVPARYHLIVYPRHALSMRNIQPRLGVILK